jgi:hypothetical protein
MVEELHARLARIGAPYVRDLGLRLARHATPCALP